MSHSDDGERAWASKNVPTLGTSSPANQDEPVAEREGAAECDPASFSSSRGRSGQS